MCILQNHSESRYDLVTGVHFSVFFLNQFLGWGAIISTKERRDVEGHVYTAAIHGSVGKWSSISSGRTRSK